MLRSKIRKTIENDILAVKRELISRGFTEPEAEQFVDSCGFLECIEVLSVIESGRVVIANKSRKRLMMILALCALRDRRRIFYWLRKHNVRSTDQLAEMSAIYQMKFEDRCPKVVNTRMKRRGTRLILNDLQLNGDKKEQDSG